MASSSASDDRARWQVADRLFDAALDLPAGERGSFFDRECGDDVELRARVGRLLAEAESEDTLLAGLASPMAGPAGDLARDLATGATVASGPAGPADLAPGATVGRYRVVRELGRGGMAVVYLAERAGGGFRQQVALKLIRPGHASEDVIRRFERERQILASLSHPGIARGLNLHRSGDHAGAVPWFEGAAERATRSLGEYHPLVATALKNLGDAYWELGDPARAAEQYRRVVALREVSFGRDHLSLMDPLYRLGRARFALGDPAGAVPLLRRSLAVVERQNPDSPHGTTFPRFVLGRCLTALGRYQEAEATLLATAHVLDTGHPEERKRLSAALTDLYRAWGRTAEAERWERFRALIEPPPPEGPGHLER